jgi:hypothetical protein
MATRVKHQGRGGTAVRNRSSSRLGIPSGGIELGLELEGVVRAGSVVTLGAGVGVTTLLEGTTLELEAEASGGGVVIGLLRGTYTPWVGTGLTVVTFVPVEGVFNIGFDGATTRAGVTFGREKEAEPGGGAGEVEGVVGAGMGGVGRSIEDDGPVLSFGLSIPESRGGVVTGASAGMGLTYCGQSWLLAISSSCRNVMAPLKNTRP